MTRNLDPCARCGRVMCDCPVHAFTVDHHVHAHALNSVPCAVCTAFRSAAQHHPEGDATCVCGHGEARHFYGHDTCLADGCGCERFETKGLG